MPPRDARSNGRVTNADLWYRLGEIAEFMESTKDDMQQIKQALAAPIDTEKHLTVEEVHYFRELKKRSNSWLSNRFVAGGLALSFIGTTFTVAKDMGILG